MPYDCRFIIDSRLPRARVSRLEHEKESRKNKMQSLQKGCGTRAAKAGFIPLPLASILRELQFPRLGR